MSLKTSGKWNGFKLLPELIGSKSYYWWGIWCMPIALLSMHHNTLIGSSTHPEPNAPELSTLLGFFYDPTWVSS